jgi:hypothetical protein
MQAYDLMDEGHKNNFQLSLVHDLVDDSIIHEYTRGADLGQKDNEFIIKCRY